MTTEQLGGFEPQEPGRRRHVWTAVAVVAVAVVAWSLTVGRPEATPPQPSPSPSQHPSPPSAIATDRSPLQLNELCDPVTIGRDVVQLSFTLMNASEDATRIDYVRPVLPMGELEPRMTDVALGSCFDDLDSADQSHLVAPGETVHVRFTLGLPTECPQPYPVNAEVTVTPPSDAASRRYGVGLYPDLGSVEFPTCG